MLSSLPILLAAGINEIVSVLVGLAFFVIWVINQINDAKKKQAAQEQRKQLEAQQPPAAQTADAGNAPPADPLRSQVDEFLRRAGKQPAPAQGGQPPRPPRKPTGRDEIVVLLDDSAVAPPRVAPARKTLAERMLAKTDAADIQRAKPTASQRPREPKPRPAQRPANPPRPQSVAEHVAQRIGASSHEFRKEVADLGARVKQADEQFDRQIQQKFDHQVSTLATSTATTPPAAANPVPPAAQIATMLANPEGVRQAMILNEILNRPTDRW